MAFQNGHIRPSPQEFEFLGIALYTAQRAEVVLYSIASFLSHLPAAQKDKRLRNLTPEKFMGSDLSEIKVTLGQLAVAFGPAFLIEGEKLDQFVEMRNLVVHNFHRTFYTKLKTPSVDESATEYLRSFIVLALHFDSVFRGMFAMIIRAVAVKEGREVPVEGPDVEGNIDAFHGHVRQCMAEKLKKAGVTIPENPPL